MNKQTLLNDLFHIYHKTADIEDFDKFRKSRQSDKIWWHLKNFGSITGDISKKLYGIPHYPSAIRDIRNNLNIYGENKYIIIDVPTKGKDRWGNMSNFVTYTLKAV